MRASHWLLLLSMALASTPANAEGGKPSQDQRISQGLKLLLQGERQEAWNILLPEANTGNVIAMYHLGVLMMKSPDVEDHLQKAGRFFSAAAERGHKGSAAMLEQVKGMLSRAGGLQGIAATSGVPLPKDLEAAKRAYAQAQARLGRFVGELPSLPPQVTIKAFISENGPVIESLVTTAEQARTTFGEKVEFQFYVVIDQGKWEPRRLFDQQFGSLPLTGFRPDLNGMEAAKYGVQRTPAIVFVPDEGPPRVIENANAVISEISSVLR